MHIAARRRPNTRPFFGRAVSSTISHASTPPTILSASTSSAFSSGAGVPYAAGDEVMKLIVSNVAVARRRLPPGNSIAQSWISR